jgi:hypothetical protein
VHPRIGLTRSRLRPEGVGRALWRRQRYDDGKLRSTIDGVVSKVLVSPGSVVRPGEPMVEIVGKHRFVVTWFPVSRLYRLAETAPALASISPPESGLYRRNASGRQSRIRQMLCLLE